VDASSRYGLVRAIAFVLKLLAWLFLILGVVGAIFTVVTLTGAQGASRMPQLIGGFGLLAGTLAGIVWFVLFYAFGSILSLLVQIEENTRLQVSER
jgi:protein-S-isoprenylcysteine O-methyltransferase Ste14